MKLYNEKIVLSALYATFFYSQPNFLTATYEKTSTISIFNTNDLANYTTCYAVGTNL